MAIYHFSAKVIQRSHGGSAVRAAAYRSASRMEDEHLGQTYDYQAKTGVVHSEILLPENAPDRWQNRSVLWNEVEATERRKDAVLAREVEFALPRELSQPEGIALARDFVRDQFVARGMVADLNVHWTKDRNGESTPHAHVMLSMREIAEDGFGKKQRDWNDVGLLREWREKWAEAVNVRLLALGHDIQVDHRSLAAQEIDLEPQNKIGPAGARREARNQDAERAADHLEIARRNGEKIIADPNVVLDAVTRQQATFTRRDLARFVSRHTADQAQFDQAMAKTEAAPELIRLGSDGRGQDRFTTKEMLETERRMERAAAALAGRDGHQVSEGTGLRALKAAEQRGLVLGEEQRVAYQHVTSGADVALVVGYAGTGKSAMLGVARAAWEEAGYTVRGAALSGIAAEGLEGGSGITSRTLASLEFAWKDGRDLLTHRDVLVVDEAGLVGSRQMERVLSAAQTVGAKVVLIGDPEQLQSIEAGAAFRALAERHGAVEISEVRRQEADWQRVATRELATERTEQALDRYTAAGMVLGAATREDAKAALVTSWDAVRQEAPSTSQVILAYRRDDVRELNELARAKLRATGELGADQVVQTEEGARAFAAGDRLMFRRNERGLGADGAGRGVAVKNGTLGTVVAIDAGDRLTVRMDGPGGPTGSAAAREVTFSVRDYAHIDHGYAATIHKAQGVTVDRAHVLASEHMDRHAAYVALTRHRDAVTLHYGRDEFQDGRALARRLGRAGLKESSLDYEDSDLARRYAERRGLNALRPVSEIVVQAHPEVAQPEQSPRRRSKFAGLKLGTGRVAPAPEPKQERVREEQVLPEVVVAPTPRPPVQPAQQVEETPEARQARKLAEYARAWSDTDRMERAGLPVLPHQAQALDRAGDALDEIRTQLARDTRAALERSPELAQRVGQPGGVAALEQAVGVERQERQALEARGWAMVRTWNTLEQEYEAAGKVYEWDAQRAVGTRLEALAQDLKRDPQLDGLLRARGRELGIEEDSRLDRVVQAEEITWRLTRSIGLEHGARPSRGMSMGM
jgi:Ti-type conjugative transfer relaxase TraA